jgi:D-serine deaminase-like pyridoxal phosphate-dependent protein
MNDARIGLPIAELDTPCLLVDLDRMEANIACMAEMARSKGVALRPHIKTHKVPAIAKMQLAAGAVGITVAKVSEAEVMAAAGIGDIFVAYPVVTPIKARRATTLVKQGCRLILGVDSLEGARVLSETATRDGITLEVRMEINTGLNRCGVTPAQAVELAAAVRSLPGLSLEGIFTFRSASFPGSAGRTIADVGQEEGEIMRDLAHRLRNAGIPIRSVSAGSSPTAPYCAIPGVTEVRPGTYVFCDNTLVHLGVAAPDQVALSALATVVSRPLPELATVDAGVKVFSGDVSPRDAGLPGHALGLDDPALVLIRMNEEHGVIQLPPGRDLRVGEQVLLIPNHVCTAVNLSGELIGIRNGKVECIWLVAARGLRE